MSKYEEDDEIHWSDEDRLFDSPVAGKGKATGANGKVTESKGHSENLPFDSEEAREAALQQELENVRKINQVIEGVVDSLEKAKGNMDVRVKPLLSVSNSLHWPHPSILANPFIALDCLAHCQFGIDASADLDPYPLAD